MRFVPLSVLVAASVAVAPAGAAESPPALEQVVVSAALRPVSEVDVPASVSVLDHETLAQAGHQHLEDVLALVPNLNWAGDTSCPRYFQLRGIGELEQYQGAPNPSVGFLVDDIDFSGLGCIATLFDVDHVEVLRGPQAMRYGANALGGLIYVRSAEPTDTLTGRIQVDAGDYGERSFGAVLSGPVPALDSGFRLAVQHYRSDGYYHNIYLNRRDVDRQGELTLRGRWRFQPSDALRVDLSALHIQIDNGYDAYTLDGSRNTQSDRPGVDSQHSTGVSLRLTYAGIGDATLTTLGTYADTHVKYSFDGDWGNPVLWAPFIYDYFDAQLRHRTTRSIEARLATTHEKGFNWLFGVYGLQLDETLNEDSMSQFYDPSVGGPIPPLQSTLTSSGYRSRTGAVFGELDGDLGERWHWTLGLRADRWTARYAEVITNPDSTSEFHPSNNLWGGSASLTRRVAASQNVYVSVGRGYKSGGFNLSQPLLPSQIFFGPESNFSVEVGYKGELLDRRLRLSTDAFYMRRHSLQVKTSEQLDPTDPNTFVLYTGNAARGFNYGFEGQAEWLATRTLSLGASLGLLQTRYHGFVQDGVTLPDRALANAPPWQAAVNVAYHSGYGPFARLDVTGMGSYYFDLPPNETTSRPYGLVNARIGWESPHWSAALWGRNLLDKNYPVRGFYFADSPSDPTSHLYTQLGDPRTFGVSLNYSFD